MSTLMWVLGGTIFISLISFVGVLTLMLKERILGRILLVLVSLSAGALMGGAFLHLMPEAIEESTAEAVLIYTLVGFAFFFLVEKLLHWRHCHKEHCEVHTFAYMNLIGDGIHNFIDGLILAASFMTSIPVGIATTFAVALHEIPQEFGDFGVLIYGGFKKGKALFMNFLCALTAVLGGLIGYVLFSEVESYKLFLLPIAAGGFLYIASSDLIPELRKEKDLRKSMVTFAVFSFGIVLMYVLKVILHG